MLIRCVGMLLVVSLQPALAQQPVMPSQTYTLMLTPEQVVTIGDGLMELPWKRANPVLLEIQRQVKDQQKPPPEKKE